MKIGIDAGALGIVDKRLKVGIYRTMVNALRELSHIDTANEYILYSFDPIDGDLMRQFGSNMENRVLWPAKGWFTIRLPLELKLHPVDVFIGFSQAIPRASCKRIGFIYDIGFIQSPNDYPGSRSKLNKQTNYLVQRADQILTISQTIKKDIIKSYGISQDCITVAYPAIDAQFSPDGDVFRGSHPYFLFVGALKRSKNIPMLLRAFSDFLSQEKKPYDLVLAGGDYWKDPQIEKEIKRLRLYGRVHRPGFVSDEELAEYYRGAIAFVSPSFHEGFCLPAVEAMATGCPVIGSNDGAFPEIVHDAGILIDPTKSDSIVSALHTITNPSYRNRLITRGYKQIINFSWGQFAQKLVDVIAELH